ncbi:MAG TPA: mycofactocin biosynthesis chaperone MftB [Streptosporangiaceae bacterium]|jgi:putative mycofactocin binding protein MftB
MPFDTAQAYEKHPKVAIRREAFGGLAYHYGNRRLTFLKAPPLVDLVEALGGFPSAAEAIDAHVRPDRRPVYEKALAGLLDSEVIRAR